MTTFCKPFPQQKLTTRTSFVDEPDNPYGASFYAPRSELAELKHSGLGISSFVLSLLSGFGLFFLIIVAAVMQSRSPAGMNEEDPSAMLLGLAVIAAGMGQLVAFILGAVGLFQPNRKKVFAILGTMFSLLAILSVGGLMILGFIIQANGG